ncbi:hypothetical protein VQ042_13545 [Aurantimonas sp. A2-1-M11]|uniref:hypothetical protein n=1 Tax=Aurantimonas sp. A2-1-M11 TaxID=3113712 RepID=UPI002F93E719
MTIRSFRSSADEGSGYMLIGHVAAGCLLRRSGERAGKLAERLEATEKANEACRSGYELKNFKSRPATTTHVDPERKGCFPFKAMNPAPW